MTTATKPTLFLIRSTDNANPLARPLFHGRDGLLLGVTAGAPSPNGLKGWRFWLDAQKALDQYTRGVFGVIFETGRRRYEVVKLEPKAARP